jgi:uncharacterized protein (TIGR02145 family)
MKNLKNIVLGFMVVILATTACKKQDETLIFTEISALEGNVGDEITLTGSALNTNLIVTFGDIEATEKTGGGKELKVKVPNGSTKGKIRITQGSNLFESAQDFTTKNYIQRLNNAAGNPYDYDIPLFYDNNKVWFKKDASQNGGTRVSNNPATYRDAAYVTWQQALNICPQGWRLPTKADFEELARATTLSSSQSFLLLTNPSAANMQFNGYLVFSVPQLWHEGDIGYYWTSTEVVGSPSEAFVLTLSKPNTVTPFYFAGSTKETGVCVRCVKNIP